MIMNKLRYLKYLALFWSDLGGDYAQPDVCVGLLVGG